MLVMKVIPFDGSVDMYPRGSYLGQSRTGKSSQLIRTTMREAKDVMVILLRRAMRTLCSQAVVGAVCFSFTIAQQTSGERELRRAFEFTATNQYDSSIAHYKIGLATYESSSRRDLYYRCIAGIADNLLRKTEFGPADSILTRAVMGVRRELGDEHQATAEIYYLLGYLRTYQDRFGEAREYYEHTLAIREAIYGLSHPQVAAVDYGLGILFERSGEYDAALRCLSRARTIQEAMGDSGQVVLANTLATIGSVYDLKSEPSKAIEAFSTASSILASVGLGDSPSSGYCFHFLAICYKSLGQSEKAVAFERKTLEIYKRIYGERHLVVAGSLAQLGDYMATGGDFEIALQCYQESSSIITALLGRNHSSANEVERKIASLYALRNDFQTALKIYLRVASHHAHDFGTTNPELGVLYHEIAEVYRKKGDLKKAFVFYSRAFTLRRKIQSSAGRLDIAGLLHDEGRAYISGGRFDVAATLLQQSLSLQDSASTGDPSLRSSTYESLAEICKGRGDSPGAVRCYQQALIALCPEFRDTSFLMNPEVPNTSCCRDYVRLMVGKAAALLSQKGKSHSTLSSLKAALGMYTLASEALKRLRSSYRSEGAKLILQEEGSAINNAGMSVAALIAQKTGDPGAREAAFSFSERGKALILLEALQNAKVRHFAGIPDRLLIDEGRLQRELTGLLMKADWTKGRQDSASSCALREAILDKNWKIDELEDSLAHLNPLFYNMGYGNHVASTLDAQNALDSGTCLVEYSMSGKSLYSFVVRKGSFDLVTLARPRNLDSLARSLRHALRTMNDRTYLSAARELYIELIQPVERYLAGARHLVIIPDGTLYYLPFEVLLSTDGHSASKNRGRVDFRHLAYLVNRFEISYALSGTLFCEARSKTAIKQNGSLSFAGFAPISRDSYGNGAVSRLNKFALAGDAGLKSMAFAGYRFGALPYSEDEVRSIATAFNTSGRIGTYVVGSLATKEEFKAHAPGHSIIHIATHGFLDEVHPGLSALLFAPGSDSTTGGNALLYAGELYNLRLDADLVTLSSCESGVGKLVRGEGLMAMTRGFFYAGARNVVCSLWKVYDKQADQLMRGFYSHVLEGRSLSSSMREAKLEMIKNAATAHPFKWAGFELIGE
jgi:CHAT domain-containing protein